ncbi:DUF6284 family protein [Kribbella sp. NPDC049174]|uniref:DUF6284 family protein n=1 Tax=Kribbella sp. NPDC049174 TaxID=3364112 RepID=UPI00371AA02F
MASLTSVPDDPGDAPAVAPAEASGVALIHLMREAQPVAMIHLSPVGGEEPTAAELATIEQEWPLIAAELDLLEAEISCITAGPAASVLDRRRVRRAQRRVLAAGRELVADEFATDGAA